MQDTEHASQRNRLLELLKAREPDVVSIWEAIQTGGAQYGARIYELRRLGHRIQNEHGRGFRLVTKQAEEPKPEPQRKPKPIEPASDLLFPLPPREWRDDG